MAPELALEALQTLQPDSTVIDLMCGSGTALRLGAEAGHRVLGFDTDPLAILISRVSCRRIHRKKIEELARRVLDKASKTNHPILPWVDDETRDFMNFWFGGGQRRDLERLAATLYPLEGPVSDVLRVALSRIIITKDSGASLARDISHSRPHKVRETSDYDVYKGFAAAVEVVTDIIDRSVPGRARISLGDARCLPSSTRQAADLVITSPPYLNAIDYMRGHRMSLVWLGHTLSSLRAIRAAAVGTERGLPPRATIPEYTPRHDELSAAQQSMLNRYACDVGLFMRQVALSLKPTGKAVLVVGDSTLKGAYIENSRLIEKAGNAAGLEMTARRSRPLPQSSRYLPPPKDDGTALSKRMGHELVLNFLPRNKPIRQIPKGPVHSYGS